MFSIAAVYIDVSHVAPNRRMILASSASDIVISWSEFSQLLEARMHLEDEKGFLRRIGPMHGRQAQTMPTAGSTENQTKAGTAYPSCTSQ